MDKNRGIPRIVWLNEPDCRIVARRPTSGDCVRVPLLIPIEAGGDRPQSTNSKILVVSDNGRILHLSAREEEPVRTFGNSAELLFFAVVHSASPPHPRPPLPRGERGGSRPGSCTDAGWLRIRRTQNSAPPRGE